jgi:UDP-N-acetylglucosamine--N-acetylmuramyl-(pentapeptide) pyrophosphoryl-undecaprenol N-acetylglucosamine transferase
MVLHPGTASEVAEDNDSGSHVNVASDKLSTPSRARTAPVPARRLLIVVGSTAGHVYPALAIADAYRAACGTVDARFAGVLDGPAASLLAARGLRLDPVDSSPLANVGLGGKIVAAARVVLGIPPALSLLRAHGTRLCIGLGSSATGAVLLAARALGVRVAIHEANVVPGIANRLLAPFAHRIYLGSAAALRAFPARSRLVTGHPVRAEIAALAGEHRAPIDRGRAARVLVLSSTRGGLFLARHIPDLLAEVVRRGVAVEALHQASDTDPGEVAHAYRRAGITATVIPYLDEIASAYRWADLVIARSGAGTIAEVAAAGVPALLVPLADAAGDHQSRNAAAVAAAGAALAVREAEWHGPALGERLAALLGDPDAWKAASAAIRRLAVPDAAARIVADCESMMAGRW